MVASGTMKTGIRALVAFAALAVLTPSAFSADTGDPPATVTQPPQTVPVVFKWDANPEREKVVGYKLKIVSAAGDLREIDVPGATETPATVSAGDVATVRAYNEIGLESSESEPLAISAPGKPGALRMRHTVEIQESSNLKEWRTLATVTTYDSADRQGFFRAAE